MAKLEDYRRMGVSHVLVIDPEDRRFYRYLDGSLDMTLEDVITLGPGPMILNLPEIEQFLD